MRALFGYDSDRAVCPFIASVPTFVILVVASPGSPAGVAFHGYSYTPSPRLASFGHSPTHQLVMSSVHQLMSPWL
ncbi:hypothetical protein E2C01_092876 [Portunus trituberculatus]|uniref:Uncharacterized protein n=1 Tax=Portunus trituberculatus TaxID=210409 RepID=A0A5B7JTD2_PORTR|nr:hypothetical protein [Portunus trituberculatus]